VKLFQPYGLRGRVVLGFGIGMMAVCGAFALTTYFLARDYMVQQRERSVLRAAFSDAGVIRDRMRAGADVQTILHELELDTASAVLVYRDGQWHSSSPDTRPSVVPARLVREVEAGQPAFVRDVVGATPSMVVGIRVPSVSASIYEVRLLAELNSTLRLLGSVLAIGAFSSVGLGAVIGMRLSRTVLQPLDQIAGTAAAISGGELSRRLPDTRDPELATLVGSFNSMVDALQLRIERDARFAADVSHELRSPLTTLVASVGLLKARRDQLPDRSRQAVDLIDAELGRFRRLLDDLIELARSDAGLILEKGSPVLAGDLLRSTLSMSGRATTLLSGDLEVPLRVDKVRMDRAVTNLCDNADRHGGGLVALTVEDRGDEVRILVDDAGGGVPPQDRERIFERFATGRSGRGSSSGTGLGLALVAQTVTAHEGAVWCADRPGGGARFVISIPAAAR
jgi:two-component system sensor histidine kinase MtrB